MVVEINEMIDFLDDFFKSGHHETVVGGIAGTQIEKFVVDATQGVTEFSRILFINGCQDYIGLMKKQLPNVLFWGDLFIEQIVDPLIPRNPWIPEIYNTKPEFIKKIDSERLSHYDVMVVFNSHLIWRDYISQISENFSGKIVYVCDPCEPMGGSTMWDIGLNDIPVVVDTLEKVSPMIAMARASLGYESRAIDRKVRGTLTEINKLNRRSIGKIDDKQYVTNDYDLYGEIRKKQLDSPFRKNQKVIVNDDIIDVMIEGGLRKASLVKNSMLVIQNATTSPLMKLRLYNSNITYSADVTYKNGVMIPRGMISVSPANILMAHNICHHRYNHIVLILDEKLPLHSKYSILKNSNNVTVVNKAK